MHVYMQECVREGGLPLPLRGLSYTRMAAPEVVELSFQQKQFVRGGALC